MDYGGFPAVARQTGAYCALLFCALSAAEAESVLTFEKALQSAIRDTPALVAATVREEAAREAIPPAGQLPDPKLLLGIDNIPIDGDDRFATGAEPMTMRRIGIMQEFPNRSKRQAWVQAAKGRAAFALAQTRVTERIVLRETAGAWISRHTVEHQLAHIQSLFEENRLFHSAIMARVRGGQGTTADAILPDEDKAAIEDRIDQLQARRTQTIAALTRWIGPLAQTPLGGDAPDWPIDRTQLQELLPLHPELAAYAPQARILEAEVAEARSMRVPDWSVELAYQKRGPRFDDMAMLQFRLDLPLFTGSRQNPRITSKQLERNALDADRQTTERELRSDLEADLAEFQRLVAAEQRQRELLALARKKISLTTSAWQGGKSSLTELIDARRQSIDLELKSIELDGERRQMAARLHYTYAQTNGMQP